LKLYVRTGLATITALTIFSVVPALATGQQTPPPAAPQADGNNTTPAQPVRRLADGHPDLNGFYASSSGPDTPVGATFGPRPKGAPRLSTRAAAKARHDDPNQPPYKPELLAKVEEHAKMESKDDPAFYCKQGGVPRMGPPHAIVQAPGMPIVFLYQVTAGNTFRLVPMDGRPHDPNAEDLYLGDSIGHWDRDTLVVDTVAFNDDTWLGIDGWYHSTALHTVERITRQSDGIRYEVTVEDPNVFTRAWTMNPRFAPATTDLIMESGYCKEVDESNITIFDEKTRYK